MRLTGTRRRKDSPPYRRNRRKNDLYAVLERFPKQRGSQLLSHQPIPTEDARKRVPPRGERTGSRFRAALWWGKRLGSRRIALVGAGGEEPMAVSGRRPRGGGRR